MPSGDDVRTQELGDECFGGDGEVLERVAQDVLPRDSSQGRQRRGYRAERNADFTVLRYRELQTGRIRSEFVVQYRSS